MKNLVLESDPKDSSPEIRAFVYQELNELQSLLPEGTAISVVVEDPTRKPVLKSKLKSKGKLKKSTKKRLPKNDIKKVSIHLKSQMGDLLVQSSSKDVYNAIAKAKEDLKNQLHILNNFLNDPNERSEDIENIINKNYLLH